MREIDLKISNSVSTDITFGNQIVFPQNGKLVANLGSIDVEKGSKEIAIARKNGGQILYATTSIESSIKEILLLYFMGLGIDNAKPEKKDLFNREILQAPHFSLNAKKELLIKVINQAGLLAGKKKNSINQLLKSIIDFRNMFAHGDISYNEKRGCLISYYQRSATTRVINDDLLTEVEETFAQCVDLLKEVNKNLHNKENKALRI